MKNTLLKTLQDLNIRVSVKDGDLKVNAPKGAMTKEIIEDIKANKAFLIQLLSPKINIPKAEVKEAYKLTPPQYFMWFTQEHLDSGNAYAITSTLSLEGDLELNLLEKAFQNVIRRHESLRTLFVKGKSGEVRQRIVPTEKAQLNLTVKELQSFKEENVNEEIEKIYSKNFDLSIQLPVSLDLVSDGDQKHVLVFQMHHIIGDGWSLQLLAKEVMHSYSAFLKNSEPALEPLSFQFKDYSEWVNSRLEDGSFEKSVDFWKSQFSTQSPGLNLVSTKRPEIKTYNGATDRFEFSKSFTDLLRKYTKENQMTLFMTVFGGLNGVFNRYTGQTDITIGTTVAGRDHISLENQIGLYSNALAIRSEFSHKLTFGEFMENQKNTILRSFEHKEIPFATVVHGLSLSQDLSRSPLFDIMVLLQNHRALNLNDQNQIDGVIQKEYQGAKRDLSQLDLSFVFEETDDALALTIEYNTDIYSNEFVKNLVEHFNNFLSNGIKTPDVAIDSVNYVSLKEQELLLENFGSNNVTYPVDETILDLFTKQVDKTPNAIALVFEENSFTFKELDILSNQLSQCLLQSYTLNSEDFIGIRLERSEWLVVSMLGVMKTGCAYVPIDPSYPENRIAYIEQDSNCKLTIDDVFIDNFEASDYSKKAPKVSLTPSNLVYVIYTSGSTGTPKGVMVEHCSLVNISYAWRDSYGLDNMEVSALQLASFSFDVFFGDFCRSILNGGKLVICKNLLSMDFDDLYYIFKKQQITIVESTPALLVPFFQYLNSENLSLDSLQTVILGSDVLKSNDLKFLLETYGEQISFINSYGLTEASIDSSYYEFDQSFDFDVYSQIPIGFPYSNVKIYILDSELNLVPPGVVGELCIGGSGLARGYLNLPELTNERFVNDPFDKGNRLYRTNDLSRWLPDGSVEFIGRKDDQVKVRGQRIELGEIEHALSQIEGIQSYTAVVKETKSGEKELVAYLTSEVKLTNSVLREELMKSLPEYMLPGYYVQLEKMPITSNGKIDKKNLPDPNMMDSFIETDYIAPRNEMEKQLVQIWETILNQKRIGVKDNFFSLGGHSLKAVQLISEYHKTFEVKIALKDLFINNTLEGHSLLIQKTSKTIFSSIPNLPNKENYAISDAQHRLWVLSQMEQSSVAYNMPFNIRLTSAYNVDNFKKALRAVIERHEILRTTFKTEESGEVRQYVLSAEELDFQLNYEDFRDEMDKETKVSAFIEADSIRPFDLENGPLLRTSLIQLEDENYVFYYNMHHIISDGWSIEILARDVMAFYNSYESNESVTLPELKVQYKDYAAWQLSQLSDTSYETHRAYWLDKFKGSLPLLDLPTNKLRPVIKTYNGRNLRTYLSKSTSTGIKKFSNQRGGTVFMGLLAAWNTMLSRYSSAEDLIIGSPIAGREHSDLKDQIGFYVNTLAFRNSIEDSDTFESLFDRVKESSLEAFDHQMYPFDRLIEDLELTRDVSRSALFDVMFIFQNNGDKSEYKLSEEGIELITDLGPVSAKFDVSITMEEIGEYLSLSISYNTDVYSQDMVENLMRHYRIYLAELVNDPKSLLHDHVYLSEEEQIEILEEFNDTTFSYSKEKTILDLFGEQILKTPDTIALVYEDRELTYRELDEKSNQLAHYLKDNYNITKEDLVGIKLERSEWMIISILAVLKTGGAYVPIDPAYPEDRITYIEQDTKCKVCISDEEIVKFNSFDYPTTALELELNSSDLAYVIYTSGSTGKPKGVMIEHHSLLDYTLGIISNTEIENCRSFGLMSTIAADLGNTVLFPSLIMGGELHIFSNEEVRSPDLISKKMVDCIKIVPSHWKALQTNKISFLPNKCLIFGGEQLSGNIVESIRDHGYKGLIYNHYGPTETTIGKLLKKIDYQKDDMNISLGKPFSDTQVYILNNSMGIQPIGVIGEICIGGAGLSRGYLNRADLTKEKFVSHPFKEGDRLYKTGDLGRWLSDGTIEFIGRKDDQVKIRGHRIELGEIEHVLSQASNIESTVVVVRQNDLGANEIVAYVTSEEELTSSVLREELGKSLPDYMLPSYYVQLDALPLTLNGKVDRKNLPSPEIDGMSSGLSFVAASTEKEQLLISVCEDVLKRTPIGVNDSFYNLGGDSIKSIQVVSRLKQQGYSLKLEDILGTPILSDLSKLIVKKERDIDQSEVSGTVDLTPIQEIFFLNNHISDQSHYNQSVLLQSEISLDSDLLERSIERLVAHHDALRMVYRTEGDAVVQYNHDTSESRYTFSFHDLRDEKDELTALGILSEQAQESFDLSQGPLFTVLHFRLSDGDRIGLFCHHLVIDGISWRILLEDLSSLYQGFQSNGSVTLPLKTDSFQRWSFLQKEYAQGLLVSEELGYWESLVSQELPDFPVDTVTSDLIELDRNVSFVLDKDTTELLQTQVHDVYNTEINDVLLTGLGLGIKKSLGISQSVIKMEGHGREEIIDDVDISRTVGWFTSVYPFVLGISSEDRGTSLMEVKESLREIPNKGVGYGMLRYLTEGLGKELAPSIVFNYLGDFGSSVSGEDGASLFEYSSEYKGNDVSSVYSSELLNIVGILVGGELIMNVRYSSSVYDDDTMDDLIAGFEDELRDLIDDLSREEENTLTPSDLTFKGLGIEELLDLNRDNLVEDVYRLSPLQEGMYFHWLSSGSSNLYFEQMSYRLSGVDFSIDSIKTAYDQLVSRHDVLRTSFTNSYGGELLQIVRKEVPSSYRYTTLLEGLTSEEKDIEIQQIKKRDLDQGFDLNGSSQMRLEVVDLGDNSYEFIWSHHHILMDGWCLSILINDFFALLTAIENKSTAPLAPPASYSNYIQWLDGIDKEATKEYWRDYLSGYESVVEVPFKNLTPSEQRVEDSKEIFSITGELYDQLEVFCNNQGITQNTFVQGLWGYLLSQYNNTNDAVFGAVVSGRPGELEGVEDMVGLFINTIPVRVQYDDSTTAEALFKQLHQDSISGNAHHYTSLSSVQEQSELGADLLNHILVFENYAVQEAITSDVQNDSTASMIIEGANGFEQTNYDFNIIVIPEDKELTIELRYDTNSYDSFSISGICAHLENLTTQIVSNKGIKLKDCDYLTAAERTQVLEEFNDTTVLYPNEKTIIDLFSEQILKTPDTIALVYEDREFTYRELDEKSNQLANYLLDNYDIAIEDLIGIKLERSEWMIISILGILKTGGAYVPIDPAYPEDRINYIEEDCEFKVCIDNDRLQHFIANENKYSKEIESRKYSSDSLGYVMYTSGSTGKPKGVLAEQKSIVRLVRNTNYIELSKDERILGLSNFSFDGSTFDIFIALLNGGTLVVTPKDIFLDLQKLNDILEKQGISSLFVTTVLFNTMVESRLNALKGLKHVLFGGEQVSVRHVEDFRTQYPEVNLHHVYGPTENTTFSTYYKIENIAPGVHTVPIGGAISNSTCYILNTNNNPVPIGIVGEICVGGDGLSRGYLNRPDLTREKFIVHPFKEGERLYKTGDLGRWLADGSIEFIGRKDHQVKIRGHRIEPGEIEHVLSQLPGIDANIVIVREVETGDKEIVAYVTSEEKLTSTGLRESLQQHLPDYMLPLYYVQLDSLPLTLNGKVDRKQLPAPEVDGMSSGSSFQVARTEKEQLLVSVFEEVLKRSPISISDSFYNLGGDSIKSIQVVSRLKQQGYSLKLEDILRTPVLSELSKLIVKKDREIDQSEISGEVALTPIQKVFFEDEYISDPSHYNQSVLLRSEKAIDVALLERSIEMLVAHHDALRMVFRDEKDVIVQYNTDTYIGHYNFSSHDLRDHKDELAAMGVLSEQAQESFDLSQGPLFAVVHYRLSDGDRIGLFCHHLVIDGVSWRILLEDLSTLYQGLRSNGSVTLPLKTDSFQRWSFLQKEYAQELLESEELGYWESVSNQKLPAFPVDKEISGAIEMDRSVSFVLDEKITELLQTQVHDVYNTEINDVLLTGLGLGIKKSLGVSQSVIKMEGHGREEIIDDVDISRTVGWFTSVYPFVLGVSSEGRGSSLMEVKESLREIPNKGVGYGMLRYLTEGLDKELAPSIVFNYLGDFGSSVSGEDGVSLFEYSSEYKGVDSASVQGKELLNVTGMLVSGKLNMSIRYSSSVYNDDTIDNLITGFEDELRGLIDDLSREEESILTPSDLTFKGLDIQELMDLNRDNLVEDVYRLSPLQEGMYFHWASSNSSSLYFEQMSYRLRGVDFSVDSIKTAYDQLVSRHDVLRTSFTSNYGGEVLQIVRKEVPSSYRHTTLLEGLTSEEKDIEIQQIKKRDLDQGFDLNGSSQMRLEVVDLGDDSYEFIWSFHHILMDGWCLSILINDFFALLTAIGNNSTAPLTPPASYSNYIQWLDGIDKEATKEYWRDYLSGYESVVELPFKKLQTSEQEVENSKKAFIVKDELYDQLETFCNTQGITQNTFVQGLWGYLLSQYNNTNDAVFGAVVSGRPGELEGVEDMVGLFINTIPVRVQYDDSTTVGDLFKQLQQDAIAGNAHHYTSLSSVQEQSEQGTDLINHILIFENYAVQEAMVPDVQNSTESMIIEEADGFEQTNYDFNIVVIPREKTLVIEFRYDKNSYDQSSIDFICNHLENLTTQIVLNANLKLNDCDYLSQEEQIKILEEFNDTTFSYPKEKTILDLFSEQILKTPDTIALVYEDRELTYRELDEKSNQLAHYLKDNYNITKEDLVGIKLERSEWMIISILGILKAGGAYVPIDPAYPEDRIAYIEKSAECKICIDNEELVNFNSLTYPNTNLGSDVSVNNLAYVIYTSGSTGKPKGVTITHGSLFNYLKWAQSRYLNDDLSNSNFGLCTSLSFDLTVTSLYLPIISGSTLTILESGNSVLDNLVDYIKRGISCIKLTPAHISLLDGCGLKTKNLGVAIVGGEALSQNHINILRDINPTIKIYNEYGPTEATVGCIVYDASLNEKEEEIKIGLPISNTNIYILNNSMGIQPIGVIGEICIGGAGLSRGYLNRADLTKEKFVSHPFKEGDRLYKTGDLGRWLSDGTIEFIGRKDDQVKIRGHRIELGEIEHVLSQASNIESTVVVVRQNDLGANEIVAYVTSEEELTSSVLREELGKSLPDYMLPSYYVQLDALPLTLNGKVDRKNLPSPEIDGMSSGLSFVAASTEKEQLLISVCEDVLKRTPIGVNDSFYNLGGDSIKSIQVVSRLKQQGYSLKLEDILGTPILSDLSKLIVKKERDIDQSEVSGTVDLTPIQEIFFLNNHISDQSHYNQSVLLQSEISLDSDLLERSIERLVAHHDALRMVYRTEGDAVVQYNHDTSESRYTFSFHDLRDEKDELTALGILSEQAQESFDLSQGPLFTVLHFRLSDGDRIGLFCHHLVIDGISWRILLEDLSSLYQGFQSNGSVTLPLKTDSFQRWSFLQKEYAQGLLVSEELGYWESLVSQELPDFPVDTVTSDLIELDRNVSFVLDKDTTELLQTQVHDVYNTEINDVLLTGLGLGIKKSLGISQSVIKMEGHGREEIIDDVDISRTVGWFTSVYPFVLGISSEDRGTSLMEVKESLREIPNKGVGYGMLRYLTEGLGKELAPSIVFNYLGDFGSSVSGEDGASLFEYSSEYKGNDVSSVYSSELLNIVGILVGGELIMNVRYSSSVYDDDTMDDLIAGFEDELRDLIDDLSREEENTLTPSDLTFKGLGIEELLDLNRDNLVEDVYRLSPLQEGMYFHWLSSGSSNLYFEQMSYRLSGVDFSIDSIKTAYDQLVSRHDVLRTSFTNSYGGELLQIVRKEVPSSYRYTTLLEGLTSEEKDIEIQQIKKRDLDQGFDLNGSSQMRLEVVDLGDNSYEFIWSHHHILMDGWCLSILINDFFALLTAIENKSTAPLAPPASYSNYIQWLDGIDKEATKEYWRDYLSGYESVVEVPFKNLTPSEQRVEDSKEIFSITGELYDQLEVFCNNQGITQNTFVQGLWGYLLSQYNNTNDAVFGAVVSGRPGELEGVEDMVGLFINTIPVRVQYDDSTTAEALFKQLHQDSISGNAHHYTSLSSVQEQSELGADLLNHILVFENYAVQEAITSDVQNDSTASMIIEGANGFEQTNYDFNIIVIPEDKELTIELRYDTNSYDSFSISGICAHLENLTTQIVSNKGIKLKDCDYLTAAERTQVLEEFNDTTVLYPNEKTIIDLFSEQILKTPDTIALVYEDREFTYRELDEKSNQLANYLLDNYDIAIEDLIGIKLERSEWMIISILGILKTGGAYVPIDPAYPEDRINYIEEDCEFKVCIDNDRLQHFIANENKYSKEIESRKYSSDSLGYVMYTSGSTGKPKGVLIEQKSIVRLVRNTNYIDSNTPEKVLGLSNFSFDASTYDIFIALLNGGTLVMTPKDIFLDLQKLNDILEKQGISSLFVTTVLFNTMVESRLNALKGLKHVLFGGEQVSVRHVEDFRTQYPEVNLYHVYGPTENTTYSTYYKIENIAPGVHTVPIGGAISNSTCYILNTNNNPVPIGIVGEICVGGDGLSRGYLNRPDLTREKFIVHPFKEGERLYKTGDLGRWLADGSIEFIGRKDHQVKIRGHRIEPGEIEHVLSQLPGIDANIVIVREVETGDKEIVAYVTSEEKLTSTGLRESLQQHLPDYMLPLYYVQLDSLPLTLNGKVDRKQLPAPEVDGMSSGSSFQVARTEKEQLLVSVFEEVLKRSPISISDSFYNLGGDSIKSIQVVSRLKQQGYSLKLEDILRTPVLSELSKLIVKKDREIDQSEISGEVALTPIQKVFFEDEYISDPSHYNQSVLLRSEGAIDVALLERSIEMLVAHHDALRMVFRNEKDVIVQYNTDTYIGHYNFSSHDLRDHKDELAAMGVLSEQAQESFDLSQGPLFAVVHYRLSDGDRIGLFCHHLVIDGVSWRILLEDLSTLYQGLRSNGSVTLPLKTDSFQRWSFLQKEYAQELLESEELGYWESVSNQKLPAFPVDKEISGAIEMDRSVSFVLDEKITELLQTQVHDVYNTEINDVLLTGLGLGIKKSLGVSQSVIKMEGHGREEIIDDVDISRTVGWFTSVYPFVLGVSSEGRGSSLMEVKESLREIPNKGVGYGMLRYLTEGLDKELAPSIVFNYLGDFGSSVSGEDGVSLFEYSSEYKGVDSASVQGKELLNVTGMLVSGKLNMSIRYSSSVYNDDTIDNLITGFEDELRGLIDDLSREEESILTPSDLTFKGLDIRELMDLNRDNLVEDVYRLSPLQEGMYFHWASSNSSSLYFEQMSYRLRGVDFSVDSIKTAYDQLVSRHDVLRTSFTSNYGGEVLQIVRKEVPSSYRHTTLLEGLTSEEKDIEIQQIKKRDLDQGFDLNGSSQMRLEVVDLGDDSYEFIWSFHHILMDGWCLSILINDFFALLTAIENNSTAPLAPPASYSNYIQWLDGIDKEATKEYWRDYLSGYESVVELPFKKLQTSEQEVEDSKEVFSISGKLYDQLETFCNTQGITQNTFVQGLWGYLLSQYNNTNDAVFGAVVSGRPGELEGVENMVGLFINTIPVRVQYDDSTTVGDLFKQLQQDAIAGNTHHYTSLADVQEQSKLGMNLINHILAFENFAVQEEVEPNDQQNSVDSKLIIEGVDGFEQTNYDFNIVVIPREKTLVIELRYNNNSYDQSSIKVICNHLENLTTQIVLNANLKLNDCDYLSQEERAQVLEELNSKKELFSIEENF